MNGTAYRFLAIVVSNGAAYLAVRIVERRYPELRGALHGLYTTVMVCGFCCFFRDMPALWVAPMFLLSAAALIISLRKRLPA
ncbi:MAG: hypothetical protein IPH09_15685 [bacterium]|nr:hypothetical protein [bacterium]